MIPDAQLADLCLALYEYTWGPTETWDWAEHPSADDGVAWALKRLNGLDIIVLRGTTTVRDWARDLYALANPCQHDQLGPLHPGFFDGCQEAWVDMKKVIKNPYVIVGHSLGAARGAIITGLAVTEGSRKPVRRVSFGEPRPGFQRLRDVVSLIDTTSYRNKWDVIPALPFHIGFETYVNSAPQTKIDIAPHGHAMAFGPFAAHHMQLYREGCAAS